ncbi:MAG TPA: GyrI-like domain-containing protein [Methylophilaceae bacterium]|jgi:AraC family transcriptional regulator
MPVKPEPRIEYGNEMRLIGLRQKHTLTNLATEIPKQWVAFKTEFELARRSAVTYGVICGVSQESMEYMCGVEVPSFDAAPANAGKLIVPIQKYAVFLHEGHISEIGASWDTILHQLMPTLKLEDAHTPSFERYDHRYDAMSGNGAVEIWCPIQ